MKNNFVKKDSIKEAIAQRKQEHIRIIQKHPEVDRKKTYFDSIELTHRALPELNFEEIDTTVNFLDKPLSFPFIISPMTGGIDTELERINKNLAIAAEATQVGMGVGSQRIMCINENAKSSFNLRRYAPNTLLFANLGAVQLNYGFGIKECQKAVDVLDADALYLHLNPLQEIIQPEGNINFNNLSHKIKTIVKKLDKPVIIKEVGTGISVNDAKFLKKAGVRYIDAAGKGGTSWAYIENFRSNLRLGETFKDWGLSTPFVIKTLFKQYKNSFKIIASGGIRNGIDMTKAIILGADCCAVALPFLEPALKSPEAVIELVQQFQKEFKTAMFLLGIDKVSKLRGNFKVSFGV